MNDQEYKICLNIAHYLKSNYKNVVFHFDYAGLNLSKAQAGRMKSIQGKRGFPDLVIYEPSTVITHAELPFSNETHYSGLAIEVKEVTPFKADGSLKKQIVKEYKKMGGKNVCIGEHDHLKEQQDMLTALEYRGFKAVFGVGTECIKIIDEYLANTEHIYFKDSLLKQAGLSREGLPINCVQRNYNIFR